MNFWEATRNEFLSDLTTVCRNYGYAIDIGDGEFHVYDIHSPGQESLATLRWDHKQDALVEEDE